MPRLLCRVCVGGGNCDPESCCGCAAAADRTGRPIIRSQSAGDLGDSPEPGARHGSASPSKRSTLSTGTFNGNDVSHHLACMLHISVHTILNRPISPCPHASGQWLLHYKSLDKNLGDCGQSTLHHILCDMQGEETSLRQDAARGPRSITLPQRPSRLDPSSDHGRTTNQGGLLAVMIKSLKEHQCWVNLKSSQVCGSQQCVHP